MKLHFKIRGKKMKLKEIKNKIEYTEALKRLEVIQDAKANTPDGDELEQLAVLIQNYELKYDSLPEPTPEDVKRFYIEQLGKK
jgi:HTH-type transcriptional regulator/antitoxin HigA